MMRKVHALFLYLIVTGFFFFFSNSVNASLGAVTYGGDALSFLSAARFMSYEYDQGSGASFICLDTKECGPQKYDFRIEYPDPNLLFQCLPNVKNCNRQTAQRIFEIANGHTQYICDGPSESCDKKNATATIEWGSSSGEVYICNKSLYDCNKNTATHVVTREFGIPKYFCKNEPGQNCLPQDVLVIREVIDENTLYYCPGPGKDCSVRQWPSAFVPVAPAAVSPKQETLVTTNGALPAKKSDTVSCVGFCSANEPVAPQRPPVADKKPIAVKINKAFSNKLKGKILISSESTGAAWYVNPKDLKRYSLAPEKINVTFEKTGAYVSDRTYKNILSSKKYGVAYAGKIVRVKTEKSKVAYVDGLGKAYGLLDDLSAAVKSVGVMVKDAELYQIAE